MEILFITIGLIIGALITAGAFYPALKEADKHTQYWFERTNFWREAYINKRKRRDEDETNH